jgi:hypothetical protein
MQRLLKFPQVGVKPPCLFLGTMSRFDPLETRPNKGQDEGAPSPWRLKGDYHFRGA